MKKIYGYVIAAKNYLQTPKGRHDFFDCVRAAGIFALMNLAAFIILR